MSLSNSSRRVRDVALTVVLPILLLAASCGAPELEQAAQPAVADGAAAQPVADEGVDDALHAARLSFIEGDVAIRPAEDAEWEVGEANAALFEGYDIYTDDAARAEVALGHGEFVRFGDGASASVTRLEDDWAQFGVTSGTCTLALDQYDANEHYEINAPGGALIPRDGGTYRVDVDEDGRTIITVLSGTAEITTPSGTFEAVAGDVIELGYGEPATVEVEGGGAPVSIDVASNAAPAYADDWDDWNYEREDYYDDLYERETYEPVRSLYGRDDIHGVAELVAYGVWQLIDNDRYVWRPNVGAGWAPYQDGYWDYAPAAGWTWVSREPWGWAPYHYGRWDYTDNYGWCWAPYDGPVTHGTAVFRERYRWRPAHVYFYQPPQEQYYTWVPLAPGEPYVPYTVPYYASAPQPQIVNVNFTPRYLRERRAVYYITRDDLERRARPRRAEREILARLERTRLDEARLVRLGRPERVVAPDRVAPARLRPREEVRRRALVVDPRSVERAEKAQGKRRQIARQERAIRKGERKQLRVERRQVGGPVDEARTARRAEKAQRRAERRAARVPAGGEDRREVRRRARAAEVTGAPAPTREARPEKAQRRAERKAARQAAGGANQAERRSERGPRVEKHTQQRVQRIQQQQRVQRTPRAERAPRKQGARLERPARANRANRAADASVRSVKQNRQQRLEKRQAAGGDKGAGGGRKANRRGRP
jgi:hypothetical protein